MTINQFVGKYFHLLEESARDEIQSILDPVQQLHSILFSEETDYMMDDRIDEALRKEGINPMKKEYAEKVNAKRVALGVTPLNEAGLAADTSSMELCRKIIADTFKY